MKKWLAVWTLAGLVVPLLSLLRYYAFSADLPHLAVYLWPSSFVLMGVDGPTPPLISTVVFAWSMSIAANMLLYAAVGTLFWGLLRLARRFGNKRRRVNTVD